MLIYDGQCAFCRHWVSWITTRLTRVPKLVPSALAPLEQLGLSDEDIRRYVWLVTPQSQRAGAAAIAWLLQGQPQWGWRFVGHLIDTWPVSVIAELVYSLVSKSRRLLPGSASCEVCRGDV